MKNKLSRLFSGISLCLALTMWLSTTVFAANRYLSVQRFEQEWSNWCWAASVQMVGYYHSGFKYSQAAIVQYIYGTVVNGGGTMSEAQNALEYVSGRTVYHTNNILSQSQSISQINASHPCILQLKWTGSGYHNVVCSGYESNGSSLQVIDPAHNCVTRAFPYSQMINVCAFESGNGTWIDTLHC